MREKGKTMRLIDADALKKSVPNTHVDIFENCRNCELLDDEQVEELIDNAPTIDAVPKWIPCEERLPNDDEDVLISYCHKEGEGDTSHVYIDITSYGQMYFGGNRVGDYKHWRAPFEYFESNYEVIAWMPLPEPYEAERKDDES